MNELDLALREIRRSRDYAEEMIADIEPEAWFVMPPGGVSTIAWQVGHLAMAEYRLCLHRLRGIRDSDEELISSDFLARFGVGSVPVAGEEAHPTRNELLATFRRVHVQALEELADFPPDRWGEPPEKPHRLYDRKIDGLWWRVRHEMLHVGQLALLRRQLGSHWRWRFSAIPEHPGFFGGGKPFISSVEADQRREPSPLPAIDRSVDRAFEKIDSPVVRREKRLTVPLPRLPQCP
ncbi:MAG TPA: DinB family protein [Pirellulaceae bacterium]|jgi:hypothetical protein|nr:DinB family protein [Pirellulaceae bacterium]